jgi:hypothetical protein
VAYRPLSHSLWVTGCGRFLLSPSLSSLPTAGWPAWLGLGLGARPAGRAGVLDSGREAQRIEDPSMRFGGIPPRTGGPSPSLSLSLRCACGACPAGSEAMGAMRAMGARPTRPAGRPPHPTSPTYIKPLCSFAAQREPPPPKPNRPLTPLHYSSTAVSTLHCVRAPAGRAPPSFPPAPT